MRLNKSSLVFSVAFFLITGCNNKEIDSLNTDVSTLKDLQIASIKTQAENISHSIEILNSVNGDIDDYLSSLNDIPEKLQNEIEAIDDFMSSSDQNSYIRKSDIPAKIEALKALLTDARQTFESGSEKLKGKKDDLSKLNKEMQDYVATISTASGDWAKYALSTLELSRTLSDEISELTIVSNSLDNTLYNVWESASELYQSLENACYALEDEDKSAVSSLVSSLYEEICTCRETLLNSYAATIAEGLNSIIESAKSWVNGNLDGYYTINQVDQIISNLENEEESRQKAMIVYLKNAITSLKESADAEDEKAEGVKESLYEAMNEIGETSATTIEPLLDSYDRIYENLETIAENANAISTDESLSDEEKETIIGIIKSLDSDNEDALTSMSSLKSVISKDKDLKKYKEDVSKLISIATRLVQYASTIEKDASAIINYYITLADNSADIGELKARLSDFENNLQESYEKMLEEAINKLDGKLSSEISTVQTSLNNEIKSLNDGIAGIETRVDTLESDVKEIKDAILSIQDEVNELKKELESVISRIQSVTAIPTYSDGSVGICGSTTINFEIFPRSAAEKIVELDDLSVLSLDAVYTETKASVTRVPIPIISQSYEDGIYSIEVKGDELSNEFYSGDISANARLHISSGASDIASSYFPLTYEASGNSMLSFNLFDGKNRYPALGINNHIVTICVPYGTDLSNMVAEYKTDAFKVSVNGLPQKSGANAMDFNQDVVYTLSPKAGESAEYTVKVYKFNLPTVYLATPDEVAINSKETWIAGAHVYMWHPDGTIEDLGSTSVKGRGNSTWTFYPKKPYTLKLDKKAAVLGMPKDKRWNLLANFADRSNIRNSIGLALSELTQSLDWASHGEHVELILNGSHNGLYYICEHIKVSSDRVNITEMKSTDTSDEEITGGYLMEFDSQYDEVNKFKTATLDLPCQFKSPEEDVLVPEQFNYMQNYINKVEELITGDDISESGYRDLIDIDTFIDVLFVKEITYNKEMSIPRSIYMTKDRGGKLKMGPVWDFDLDPFTTDQSKIRNKNSIWFKYLFNDPVFVARLKEKWAESKDDFLSVVDLIDELRVKLKDSADRDNEMWEINESHKYYPKEDYQMSFDDASSRLRTAVINRINLLDETINAL